MEETTNMQFYLSLKYNINLQSLTVSKANSVAGERMKIFVFPYLTSCANSRSSISTRVPSLSDPALKLGHVNWDIILYLETIIYSSNSACLLTNITQVYNSCKVSLHHKVDTL